MICFTLTMPNRASWNGKWSGDGDLYAVARSLNKAKTAEVLRNKRYYYDFGDGWCACVKVEEVTSREAAGIRRKSRGFCGYDWMINSIIKHGDIRIIR